MRKEGGPVVVSSGGLSPSNSKTGVFPNLVGRDDCDSFIEAELVAAGIEVVKMPHSFPQSGEVRWRFFGSLGFEGSPRSSSLWGFKRAWYYYVAEGPGIPPEYAEELHRTHGNDVRVNGHCLSPSPYEQFSGLAVGLYHVDTPEGLKALADTIKKVFADAKKKTGE